MQKFNLAELQASKGEKLFDFKKQANSIFKETEEVITTPADIKTFKNGEDVVISLQKECDPNQLVKAINDKTIGLEKTKYRHVFFKFENGLISYRDNEKGYFVAIEFGRIKSLKAPLPVVKSLLEMNFRRGFLIESPVHHTAKSMKYFSYLNLASYKLSEMENPYPIQVRVYKATPEQKSQGVETILDIQHTLDHEYDCGLIRPFIEKFIQNKSKQNNTFFNREKEFTKNIWVIHIPYVLTDKETSIIKGIAYKEYNQISDEEWKAGAERRRQQKTKITSFI